MLRHLPKVFLGTIDRASQYAALVRTAKLIVESSGPVPVHVDGEIYPEDARRFEIEIVPQALTVIGNWEKRHSLENEGKAIIVNPEALIPDKIRSGRIGFKPYPRRSIPG